MKQFECLILHNIPQLYTVGSNLFLVAIPAQDFSKFKFIISTDLLPLGYFLNIFHPSTACVPHAEKVTDVGFSCIFAYLKLVLSGSIFTNLCLDDQFHSLYDERHFPIRAYIYLARFHVSFHSAFTCINRMVNVSPKFSVVLNFLVKLHSSQRRSIY